MVRIRATLLSLFVLAAPCSAGAAEHILAPYLSFPVGDVLSGEQGSSWGPPDVAAGDLNADGRDDLAVVSRDGAAIEAGSKLSILLSNPNPSLPLFDPPDHYPTGLGPRSVAIADLNNDGWPDVVTADAGDNVLSVFLNQGSGKLGPRISYSLGGTPENVALGDLNADGRRDIVLAVGSGITVFMAAGSPGYFAAGVSIAGPGTMRGVAIGDVNFDGLPDVVSVSTNLCIFRNMGGGALSLESFPALLHPGSAVVLADMDGDGWNEAVVTSSTDSRVTVYTLAVVVTPQTDKNLASAFDLVARDFNEDGNMDVAVATQQSLSAPGATGFFLPGDGLYGFNTQQAIDAGAYLEAVASGDFDADGMLDLAFVGAGRPVDLKFRRAVHVVRQKSPGVFNLSAFYIHPEITMGTAITTIADMNRDGMPDMIVAGLGFVSGQASIAVRLGTSSELWDPGTQTNIGGDLPPRAVSGDFNRDGINDLAVTQNFSGTGLALETYVGDGTGEITVVPGSFIPDREALAAGDFDRDGILDLVTNAVAGLVLLKGVGDGTFTYGSGFVTSNTVRAAAVGDLNQDGAVDIVYSVSGIGTYVSLGNGTMVLNAPVAPPGPPATSITLADFDEDSMLDVLLSTAAQTIVALGDGLGTFTSPTLLHEYSAANGSFSSAALDLNRDGHMDVIADVYEPSSGPHPFIDSNLRAWLGDGKGGFGSRSDYGVPEHPLGLTLVDATRDGRMDVISSSIGPLLGAEKAVRHYTLKGNGQPATFAFPTSIVNSAIGASSQTAFAMADFTRDGTPDALVAHSKADGLWYATQMVGNGNGTFTSGISNVIPEEPAAMDTGDFNRDGISDFVIACGVGDAVLIEMGTVADTLTMPSMLAFGLGYEFSDVAVGDFNRDGKLDIAAASAASSAILIFRGNGNGTFVGPIPISTGSLGPTSIAVGDVDRDGIPDLVAALGVGIDPNSIGTMHGNGDGTFETIRLHTVGQTPYALVVGDLNRDGFLDAAVTLTGTPGNRYVAVVIGSPAGGFNSPNLYPISQNAYDLVWANVDGDGPNDLLVPNGSGTTTISFFHALGAGGTFNPKVDYTMGGFPIALAVADLNRDGRPDVIGSLSGSTNLCVLLSAPSTISAVAVEPVAGDAPLAPRLAIRPNPAADRAFLSFRLPQPGPAIVDLFDVCGRRVKRLFEGRADGDLEVTWAGQTDGGGRAASGIYFAKLSGGKAAVSRRLVWLR